MKQFLPLCKEDMTARGIEQFDFVYVIGDAYVDHPSFGHAVISRVLELSLIHIFMKLFLTTILFHDDI